MEGLGGVPRTLIGFAREYVEIQAGLSIKIVPLKFTVINAQASYNIILGQPTLNQLRIVVSTFHLCMKYPIGDQVGTIRVV
ncbi:hypothetical protein CR513_42777, partial [Mucuna pruriens]